MRVLLDTQLLIRAAADPGALSRAAVELLADPAAVPMFSVVSVWEVSIKSGLRRADFPHDPAVLYRRLIEAGYLEMPVTAGHALAVRDLPWLHRDPFDRMLLAQAGVEQAVFATTDRTLARYPGDIRLVG